MRDRLAGPAWHTTIEEMTARLVDSVHHASPHEFDSGATWYESALASVQQVALEYDIPLPVSAIVHANLSPRNAWEGNVVWGGQVVRRWRENPLVDDAFLDRRRRVTVEKTDTTKRHIETRTLREWLGPDFEPGKRLSEYPINVQADLIRMDGQADWVDDQGKTVHGMRAVRLIDGKEVSANAIMSVSIQAALKALYDYDPDRGVDREWISAHLSDGHKVRSFYNNIIMGGRGGNEVTIDTHAADVALIGWERSKRKEHAEPKRATEDLLTTLGGPVIKDKDGNAIRPGPTYGSHGAYAAFAEAFRQATIVINKERAEKGPVGL